MSISWLTLANFSRKRYFQSLSLMINPFSKINHSLFRLQVTFRSALNRFQVQFSSQLHSFVSRSIFLYYFMYYFTTGTRIPWWSRISTVVFLHLLKLNRHCTNLSLGDWVLEYNVHTLLQLNHHASWCTLPSLLLAGSYQ